MSIDLGYAALTGRPKAGVDGAPSSPPRLSVTGTGSVGSTVDQDSAGGMMTHPANHPSVWFLALLFGAAVLAKSTHIIT